ncbi:MAG: AI-2E family transporter [Chloroflexota bacterium]|nr:AI-2E family transporter [Chloroflexota bacterium]
MKLSVRERQILTVLGILLIVYLAIETFARLSDAFIRIADVVIIFLAAWALAYLLNPLVNAIDRRSRLNRAGAVFLVYAAIGIVLVGIFLLAVPGLASQLSAIQERGPELAQNTADAAKGLQEQLDRAGVPLNIGNTVGTLPARLGDTAGTVAADALAFVSAVGAIIFNTTLVLIIAFLMLMDGESLWKRFTGALSEELRSEAELLHQSADKSFGGFVRGSLLLGLFYGVATAVYLVALGVPFAGVLALIAGLAVIIPFFGPIIAMIPIIAITLLGAPDKLLWVLAVTLILQQVTLNVLGPRIIGTAVGIHPIFVFLALLLGSRIAGFWGVLLAMPIAGIIATFVRYGYELAIGRRDRTEAATLIEDQEQAAAEAAAEAKQEAAGANEAAAKIS